MKKSSGRLRKILAYCAAGIIVVAVILYVATVKVIAPWIARAEIIDSVEGSCATCEIELSNVSFALLSPLNATLNGLKMKVGYEGGSEAVFSIESIRVAVSFAESSKKKIVVESVLIDEPVITFADGDAVSRKTNRKREPGPDVVIEKVEISKGEFTYIRNTKGTSAALHLHHINGEIGPLGSARKDPAKAHLKTRIEMSGSVEIDIVAKLKGPDEVDVSVYIRDQNLADTTPFFKSNAGVSLKGTMLKGRGRVRVRDQKMKASVWAVYHGLELELNPMYDRTKSEAFFMNLGADLVMTEDDVDLAKADQTQALDVPREKNERIIGYVLRGLKEAAIKVAMKAPSKSKAAAKSSAKPEFAGPQGAAAPYGPKGAN